MRQVPGLNFGRLDVFTGALALITGCLAVICGLLRTISCLNPAHLAVAGSGRTGPVTCLSDGPNPAVRLEIGSSECRILLHSAPATRFRE